MKLKRTLIGLVCLTSVFSLFACKGKTTTSKETTKITTKTNSSSNNTTGNTTTEKKTTTSTPTTKKPIPSQYAVDKTTFDSFFNPDTAEKAIALNLTIEGTASINESTSNITMKIADNRSIQTNSDGPDFYHVYSIDTSGNISVRQYSNYGLGWVDSTSAPYSYSNVAYFCSFNTLPGGFDFDKLTFNFETNTYESSETILSEKIIGSTSEKMEISSFKVKFVDNKPVSYSYAVYTAYYESDTVVSEYNGAMTFTISNIGKTIVEEITVSSLT